MHLGTLTGSILIFGGPYSNLYATLAMRKEAEARGVPPSHILCNGDLVAYCASHAEVVKEIRDWGINVLMGNCEESLADNAPDCGCGFKTGSTCESLSSAWYSHANQHISDEDRSWMGKLPRQIRFNLAGHEILMVHGAPSSINRFIFASTDRDVKEREMRNTDASCIIGGHCGIPFGQIIGQGAWLNSGVIGMPANDGTPDGWYMILCPEHQGIRVSWHRLAYDWRQSQTDMHRAGLRNAYAQSLTTGLWPSMDVLPDVERGNQGIGLDLSPIMIPSAQSDHLAMPDC